MKKGLPLIFRHISTYYKLYMALAFMVTSLAIAVLAHQYLESASTAMFLSILGVPVALFVAATAVGVARSNDRISQADFVRWRLKEALDAVGGGRKRPQLVVAGLLATRHPQAEELARYLEEGMSSDGSHWDTLDKKLATERIRSLLEEFSNT